MIRMALSMLAGDGVKYAGLVAGVLFSVFLTTLLMGMFAGVMERTYSLLTDVPGPDVWVMDPAVEQVEDVIALSPTALDRVRGVEGVAWATRLYTGGLRARLADGRFRTVTVIGVDGASLVGAPATMQAGSLLDLRRPDAVVLDELSARTTLRGPAGPAGEPGRPVRVGDELSISDRRVVVAGLCRVTPRFNARPTLYTTYERAVALAPPERNLTSFVLAGVAAGQDPVAVARRVEHATGLRARTSEEFRRDTFWHFVRHTDVVAHIGMMVGIAGLVGCCVTGLMLFLFTSENLRHYASLKAMGASDARLTAMVMAQALAGGAIGYGLGLGAACAAGALMVLAEMPFRLRWEAALGVAAFTLAICTASAWWSMAKVRRLEPAMVFR